jgi:hypothetical protein
MAAPSITLETKQSTITVPVPQPSSITVAPPPVLSITVQETAGVQIITAGTQGPPAATQTYLHTQSAPSAEWIVNHNLGFKPDVTLLDSGSQVFQADIVHISVNQLRVIMATPTAGTARCD